MKTKLKNPKQKGNRYELMIAKKLSMWAYGVENLLGRTPTSGATYAHGDICPNEIQIAKYVIEHKEEPPKFPFVVECKNNKLADTLQFIFGEKKGFLGDVWEKLCGEAKEAGLSPMLCYRQNKRNFFVVRISDFCDHKMFAKLKNKHIQFYNEKADDCLILGDLDEVIVGITGWMMSI